MTVLPLPTFDPRITQYQVTIDGFKPYILIFGESSCALFDLFGTDQMFGLNRYDCDAYPETEDDAYIAGLTNEYEGRPFQFFNSKRVTDPEWAKRLIVHESLHMARLLMGYPDMTDENEEEFAELTEQVAQAAFAAWEEIFIN